MEIRSGYHAARESYLALIYKVDTSLQF